MKKIILYIITTIIIIILGLLSREIKGIPLFMGDVFWAMMVFFILAFIFFNKNSSFIFILSIIITYIIEITQLYHRPWIDNFRKTSIGHILLGQGFLWSDLIAYLAGIIIGYLIKKFIDNKMEESYS
ncbi:ribosomal maturation YjgA family protein [Vallitalea sp.]|jgi:hypothetical protein|uniref:ribosomal maturation YjgA family protein n=1 Tax=Vallitalea sp. TaxID=1882829 RepID=UPI0025D2020F|nr:DUF2809 domain-containing protein [Vallitalea sp.]MCT4688481.1 DUF2809 domain-containing protein [Vallitalea sp.]